MPDSDSTCLIVKCLASENSSHGIKSYFQQEKYGGNWDVDGVIYPLNGDKTQAAVMFAAADSVLSVCKCQHQDYTVTPAKMVFSRVEATVSGHLCAAIDDLSYDLDVIGVQILHKSADNSILLGNLLQIVEAGRILMNSVSHSEKPYEVGLLKATGSADGLLPNMQPASSPLRATLAGSRFNETVGSHEGQFCKLDGSLTQREFVTVTDKKSYQVHDMEVLVYLGDLTKLNVDAIVNPANEHLSNGAGAARAIAEAGEPDFQDLCDGYISENGLLRTGHAATLPATGKLKERGIKLVINCVGPQYSRSTADDCSAQLTDTVFNCLLQADEYGCKTVAMPAISSGIFGVPMDICTAAYIDGISKFMTHRKPQQLKTIHLVNIDQATCDEIAKAFSDRLSQKITDWETAEHRKSRGLQGPVSYVSEHGSAAHGSLEHWSPGHETAWGSRQSATAGLSGSLEHDAGQDSRQLASAGLVGNCSITGREVLHQQPAKSWWNTPLAPVVATETRIASDGVGSPADRVASLLPTTKSRGLQGPVGYASKHGSAAHWSPEQGNPEHWSPKHETAWGSRQSATAGLSGSLEHDAGQDSRQLASAGLMGSHSIAGRELLHQQPAKSSLNTPLVPVFATDARIASNGVGSAAEQAASLLPATSLEGPSYADAVKLQPAPLASKRDDNCPICLDAVASARKLPCGHTFCSQCIATQEKLNKAACPVCRKPFAMLRGNQPPGGTMQHTVRRSSLPGYPQCGCIVISYFIPGGIQDASHPNPGTRFASTSRTAYLPDNRDGRHVLDLLKKAFDQGLTFTVGTSHTTGCSDCVVWNDIHHKTSEGGGPTNYGYPDPDYLQRVREDLAAKGIH